MDWNHLFKDTGLTFFNLDLHVSVIEDVKTIFHALFPNVHILDWSISGHSHLFSHALEHGNKVLSTHNWRMFDMMTVHHFHAEYHNLLKRFDGFIVTHSPIFAMLFERYNKPVIIVNSCRYHQPLCWTKQSSMHRLFHDCLVRLAQKKLLTIVHNNVADMLFFQRRVPLPDTCQYYIPSLCAYVRLSYTPQRPHILVDDRRRVLPSTRGWNPQFAYPLSLVDKPSPFEWREVCQHRAVLLVPTEVSFMTFFEYLQACIPMIIPSLSLMESWIRTGRLVMGTLSDYDMDQEENLLRDWLPYADYYNDPGVRQGVLYFDSMDQLHDILSNPSLEDILSQKHRVLMECRDQRTLAISNAWNEVFHFDYFEFVCYNFWPCLADFHLDVDYSKETLCRPFYRYNPLHPKEMMPNSLVFIKTDLLSMFLGQIRPHIHTPFRVMLAVSDLSPSLHDMQMLVNDELCTGIYATNVVYQHHKITHLPIGFPEPMRENGDVVFLRSRFMGRWKDQKTIDMFVRGFGNTCPTRVGKMSRISEVYGCRRFDPIVRLAEPVSWKEMHGYLGRSRFALCLPGNGIDTHYFYECILNECVPVVWHDPDVRSFPLYASFPCIQFVDPRELESIDFNTFYETVDWTTAKQKLVRREYKYLKSC